jgi:hypothetical protein
MEPRACYGCAASNPPDLRGDRPMATEFFNDDMRLFIDHRVDWARYFA